LQIKISMIRVDECLTERLHCESSCTNELVIEDKALQVFTNTSSFVGVNASIVPNCICQSDLPTKCEPNPCFNQGTCHSGGDVKGFKYVLINVFFTEKETYSNKFVMVLYYMLYVVIRCECERGYDGPRCEVTSIVMDGTGYAWYPPLSVCSVSTLEIQFKTYTKNALLFYNGPTYSTNVSGE